MIPTGTRFYLPFSINQVDLLAGTAVDLVAPCDGFFEEMQTVVQVAVTTGGTLTTRIGTTVVTGLAVTIANAAVKGSVVSDLAPDPSTDATRRFKKGDRINILPASFATAGAVNGNLICRDSATLSA